MQPHPCGRPLAGHRRRGNPQNFGSVVDGQTGEEAQLNDPALLGVKLGEILKRVVEHDHIQVGRLRRESALLQRYLASAAATLVRPMSASILNQDLAHELGRHSKKVCPILPLRKLPPHQPNVSFMDKRRALQGMVRALPLQKIVRHATQFAVDDGHESVERFTITVAPTHEQLSDLIRGVLWHCATNPTCLRPGADACTKAYLAPEWPSGH